MAKYQTSSWIDLSLHAWKMGFEAQHVIGLRLAKIARGGCAGSAEAALMVSEKMQTVMGLQGDAAVALMSGAGAGIPAHALTTYRRKVRANRRRLLKEL